MTGSLCEHDRPAVRWVVIVSISAFLLAFTGALQAQDGYAGYYPQSLKINTYGMAVLGGWALTNISVGAYGWSNYSGQRAYFHQMNLFLNTV